MGIFDNTKFKKSLSVLLATLSIGGMGGCKKEEKRPIEHDPEEDMAMKSETNQNEQYNDALDNLGVEIEENTNFQETQKVPEASQDVQQEIKQEIQNTSTISKEEDAFKKSIIGTTEKDRLRDFLEEKDWGAEEEEMLLYMYDVVDENYDIREFYEPTKKQEYLRNLVDTIINNVGDITVNRDDPRLAELGASAYVDYTTGSITLKFGITAVGELRHELAHLETGSFLTGNSGAGLGFVLEEGRASYKKGDAQDYKPSIDNMSQDISNGMCPSIVISGCNGSYYAFEQIYKDIMRLGVDLEGLRKKDMHVNELEQVIKMDLDSRLGNELGTQYVEKLKNYIEFFNEHGKVIISQNEFGQNAVEAKAEMDAIREVCMVIKQEMQQSYNIDKSSIER